MSLSLALDLSLGGQGTGSAAASVSINTSGFASTGTTWALTSLGTITVTNMPAGGTVEIVDGSGNPYTGIVPTPEA
jgi:hypothetical protein